MPEFSFKAHARIGSDNFRLSQCYFSTTGSQPIGDGYVYAIKNVGNAGNYDSMFVFESSEELVNGGDPVIGKMRGALGYWKVPENRVEYTDKAHSDDFKVKKSGNTMFIMTLNGKSLAPI
ncbi:hypothetical protein BGZ93_008741 [Podila epicladia]|nr:hypothetical protein BGZ92_009123 [Podila epicladia]KAG0091648.1 hypothetical protein BGZ93_008741 [Podila epicladia]